MAALSPHRHDDIYLFNFPGAGGNDTSSDLNYVLDLAPRRNDSPDQHLQLQYRQVVPGQGAGWSLQFLHGVSLL